MKNILLAMLISLNMVAVIPAITYAQGTTDSTTTSQEEANTLSDTLDNTQEASDSTSLGTILIAVITPLLLIILGYLTIKLLKV